MMSSFDFGSSMMDKLTFLELKSSMENAKNELHERKRQMVTRNFIEW